MLTPEYLLHSTEPAEEIAEQLHTDVINRIIDRILIRFQRGDSYILTPLDKWQIETLQQAGYLLEDIEKTIAEATGKMQSEIAEAMEDAGVRTLQYDDAIYRAAGLNPVPIQQSPYMIRLMQRNYEATLGEWRNFTHISKQAVHKLFVQSCDTAYHQAVSGAISPSQAVLEALETIIEGGAYVEYPGGRRDTIETATARAVRTGISKASGDITDARMEEMDWDIILVSSHLGARVTEAEDYTNHYWWQGQFYSKSGKDKRFPPYAVCGFGKIQGIHGANCRHSHGPGDGVHNPFEHYDSEENRKMYELEQRQRELERRIRKTKRETMNWKKAADAETDPATKAKSEEKYQQKAALLQKQNKAYNKFCEETGLKKQHDRIRIAKWDRKQAAQARAAAKRWDNRVTIHEARSTDTFHVISPEKGDAIKAQSLYKELQKSEVGQKAYKYILENNVFVSVKYDGSENLRGRAFGRFITIYANETKSVKMTTRTIIHEATHLRLNRDKYTQWEEAYCYAQELKHEKNKLTWSDLRDTIKWAKKNYPDYPWR